MGPVRRIGCEILNCRTSAFQVLHALMEVKMNGKFVPQIPLAAVVFTYVTRKTAYTDGMCMKMDDAIFSKKS